MVCRRIGRTVPEKGDQVRNRKRRGSPRRATTMLVAAINEWL